MFSAKRILLMDCDCPSIYMPIGNPKDGGSCAFSSKKCREFCPSGLVTNNTEKFVLEYFKREDAKTIADRIYTEFLDIMRNPRAEKMIQWWTWGDCLPELTGKTVKIILNLNTRGVPQYGFTRNKKLWDILPCYHNLHIGLTVDNIDVALKLSTISHKMIACPDYETGYAQMIFTGKIRARCSGWWCITEEAGERNSNCTQCLAEGSGCYYR